ncbi:MAG: 30S ribosomal protein S2, partial [Candidatus Pacebacteria bacterium]|nr:30S ribosomal protein S2 [Candidatus Paceibacterota bacterium]
MIKEQNSKISENNIDIEKMVQVGLHLGHRTSRINPKMKDYIKEVKGTIHIIDLEKTIQKMAEAFQFVEDVIKEGKIILFVGTKIQIKDLVKSTAENCGLPY